MKPKLKLPGTKRLKLKCDEQLSKFAFKFKLRRYIKVPRRPAWTRDMSAETLDANERRHFLEWRRALALVRSARYCPPRRVILLISGPRFLR